MPGGGHGVVKSSSDGEDHAEAMLKKAGCLEHHYAVQECIAENKDWRKCKEVVAKFRECISKTKNPPEESRQ